jgi:hypothetical protein
MFGSVAKLSILFYMQVALVLGIDCTGTGEEICDFFGIEKLPSLMYGTLNDLQLYDGGRTFGELNKFASENLGPMCSALHQDLCDKTTRNSFEQMMDMSTNELEAMVMDREKRMSEVQEKFDLQMEDLQEMYATLDEERDSAMREIRDENGGLILLQSVLTVKKNSESLDEEISDSIDEESTDSIDEESTDSIDEDEEKKDEL